MAKQTPHLSDDRPCLAVGVQSTVVRRESVGGGFFVRSHDVRSPIPGPPSRERVPNTGGVVSSIGGRTSTFLLSPLADAGAVATQVVAPAAVWGRGHDMTTAPDRAEGWATDIDGVLADLEDALDTLDATSRAMNAAASVPAGTLARAIAHLHIIADTPLADRDARTVNGLIRSMGGVM